MADRQDTGMKSIKRYKDGELLQEMYVEEEMSTIDIAEMYEDTDASSYTIADAVDHDICPGTVIQIHREFYE